MFVIFEGPDGVGKTAITEALHSLFTKQGEDWTYLAFPGNEDKTLGKHVYNLHHHPEQFGLSKIFPESLQILHVAAHIDSIENCIKPLLKNGKNILLDRYWWSTWVYGLLNGVDQQALDKMVDLELYHWQNFSPDLLILVNSPKSFKKDCPPEKWEKLKNLYFQLFEKEKAKYPVRVLENNANFENAVKNSLSLIKQNIIYKNGVDISNNTAQKKIKETSHETDQLIFPFAEKKSLIGKPLSISLNHSKIYPVIPTKVYDTFWYFAAERQNIFFNRINKYKWPWSKDPVLTKYKFTNAYRASDRVSQYLIHEVIYKGEQTPKELFFRILLFKVFNRISTWELLINEFSNITLASYSFDKYDKVLSHAIQSGQPIFSAAYIMPSGGKESPYKYKHQTFLKLLENMIMENVPEKLSNASSMQSAFKILRAFPLIGDFLAYQYIIDINYSTLTNFSESEFVIPGPGAINGIRKCFSDFAGLSEIDLIQHVTDIQEEEFSRLGIEFKSLWGRKLQLIDCQNLFCEIDKYSRVAFPDVGGVNNRKRIKQIYKTNESSIDYWYPPKWGINHLIQKSEIPLSDNKKEISNTLF
ncbi:MAG: nucleotide kinase domain-containing protein [Anaerolineaceae bacterium]|jgi:thymidylate kinase